MYYLYLNQYTLIPIVKIQYALIPIVKITIGIRAYYLYLIQYTLIPVVKIQYALIPSMIYLGQSVNTVLSTAVAPLALVPVVPRNQSIFESVLRNHSIFENNWCE